MTGFKLSPGITPGIVEIFVLVLPLALGIGYLWKRGRGFEVALALAAYALAGVKLATDITDLNDDLVTLGAILGGTGVLLRNALGPFNYRPLRRVSVLGVATFCILVGFLKAGVDFYDPFDLLLADVAVLTGLLLLFAIPLDTGERPRPRRVDTAPLSPQATEVQQ